MLGLGSAATGGRAGASVVGAGAQAVAPGGGITTAERVARAVLVSVTRMGPLTLECLHRAIGPAPAILDAAVEPGGVERLVEAGFDPEAGRHMLPVGVAEAIADAARRRSEILAGIDRLGLRLVAIEDPDYPARLRAIEVPPSILFVRGDPRAFAAQPAVAVVGTRRPSDAGRRIASRIAAGIARAGGLVVSGLAIGIDGAAHAAAVGEGVPTVAFIGGGHARLFPRAHDRLGDAIVESGGAVVSEYAPDTEPSRGTFPQRNRLISGSADAVVVVEAGARSGALLTASWAFEQGRECFIVPGSIDAVESAGCLGFLRDFHGLARIVSGIPQLLEDLGLAGDAAFDRPLRDVEVTSRVRPPIPEAVLADTTPADRQVAVALVRGAAIVDEIVALTRLPVGAVLGALTRLETAGLVVAAHGRYRVSGPLAAVEPNGRL